MPNQRAASASGQGSVVALYLSLCVLALLIALYLARSIVIVSIDMEASKAGYTTLQWRDNSSHFSVVKSKTIAVKPGRHGYSFIFWTLSEVDALRINPLDTPALVGIHAIIIRTLGYERVVYDTDAHFHTFKPLTQLSDFKVENNQLTLRTLGSDAHLEWAVTHNQTNTKNTALIDFLNLKLGLTLLATLLVLGIVYPWAQMILFIVSIVVGVIAISPYDMDYAVISIELESDKDDQLAVYWAGQEPYSEQQVRRVNTQQGRHLYRLGMGDFDAIQHVRIDPLATTGKVLIHNIRISAFIFDPIVLNAKNQFYPLDFLNNKNLSRQGDAVVFNADTADAFFEVTPHYTDYITISTLKIYLGFIVILILLQVGVAGLKRLYPEHIDRLTHACLKVGVVILSIMTVQLVFSPNYGAFTDYQANTLVITTAGDNAQLAATNTADISNAKHIGQFGLLNLSYAALLILTFLVLEIFYSRAAMVSWGLFLVLCAGVWFIVQDKTTLVRIAMESSVENRLKVYWADEAELYQEQHSVSVNTQVGMHLYTLPMGNLNNVHSLRIEPLNTAGQAQIKKITLTEEGYAPIDVDASNDFYLVEQTLLSKATNKALSESVSLENGQLVFTSQGDDTFFELFVEPEAFRKTFSLRFYGQFFALLLGLAGSLYLVNRRWNYFEHDSAVATVRFCLTLVVVMVIQLAWLSDYDVHPDEKAHIDSIDYYTQYWDPPVVGDKRSLNTYQYPWGVSRLDDLGIGYLLMGKLKQLITYAAEDTVFTCRVFNSVLVLLLLFGTRNKHFALFLLPLLCLPQVWHLFSYANRDGFAMFLAISVAWQLVNKDSALQRYLQAEKGSTNLFLVLVPAALLGLLSIEVSNYYIFILFFGAVLCWQGLFISTRRKQFVYRCLILVLIAGSVFGVRKAIDVSINGWGKQAQRFAYAETIAAPEFKPSVAATDEGYFGLRLQQKGVDAVTLFTPRWEWQVLTFKSFAGLYGNEFAEYSPEWYYEYVAYLYALITLLLLVAAIGSGELKTWILTGLTVVFIFGDLLMGFLYSWLYDFQPQGRYIFPLIPILMVYLACMAPLWRHAIKAALLACGLFLFVLSVYSFRFIALAYLIS